MKKSKKMQAGGVAKPLNPKAPDKNGPWISVQKKVLAKGKTAKKGK